MLRVGLTGGIATGKTHVLRRFRAAGCYVLDLDQVSREVMAPGGAAYADVVAAFGREILAPDGTIDRARLGRRVFDEAGARARLNHLVHPHIRDKERSFALRHAAERKAIAVTDGALLVEVGMHLRFDRLVVVHCRPEEQLQRLRARDGLAEDAARARVASQMPIAEKLAFGHFAIDSSGTPPETDRRADAVIEQLKVLASQEVRPVIVPRSRVLALLIHGPQRGPFGLVPAAWLTSMFEPGHLGAGEGTAAVAPGPDLVRLSQMARLSTEGPWYRGGPPVAREVGGHVLAPFLAVWSLSRRGDDPEYLLGAAASLGRVFDARAEAIGRMCGWSTLACGAVGARPVSAGSRLDSGWVERVRHFGGEPPMAELRLAAAQLAGAAPEDRQAGSDSGAMNPQQLHGLRALAGGLGFRGPTPKQFGPLLDTLAALEGS